MTKDGSGTILLVEELAEKAGVSGINIRQLLRRGALKGHKRGGIWVIPLDEAEDYLERRKGRQRASFRRHKGDEQRP